MLFSLCPEPSKLVKTVLIHNYFIFINTLYKQDYGLSMGAPPLILFWKKHDIQVYTFVDTLLNYETGKYSCANNGV
jgi:hypothetical protein